MPCAARQFVGDQPGQRAEPVALRVSGVGRRAGVSGAAVTGPTQNTATSSRSALIRHSRRAKGFGALQHRRDGGCAGEAHRIDVGVDDHRDQLIDRPAVLRRLPAIHRHLDRPGRPPGSAHRRCRCRAPTPLAAPCSCTAMRSRSTPSDSKRSSTSARRLRLRAPLLAQPGLADRATRLGPAGQDAGRRERGAQLVGDIPAVGGLDPAAEADPGGHHDHVGRLLDELRCHPAQFDIVDQRDDPDRRRVHDGGAATLQQRDEFFGPARRGHPDREAGQWVSRCAISTIPSITRTS